MSASNFKSIEVNALHHFYPLSFNFYLKVTGKYILYVKRGDEIDLKRLENLKIKANGQGFVKEEDYGAYQEYLALLKNLLFNEEIPNQQKAELVTSKIKSNLKDFYEDPNSKEGYARVKESAVNQLDLLLQNPDVKENLLKISEVDKTSYQHSVNVATLSLGIAQNFGLKRDALEILGIGALLHDIGKGPKLAKTSLAFDDLPQNLKDIHLQHPRVGASQLQGKKYIPPEVLDIILLHEERLDGKGYPSGIKKMDQLYQIVALANMYDQQKSGLNLSPKEIFIEIQSMKPSPYDPRLIEALKAVLVSSRIY